MPLFAFFHFPFGVNWNGKIYSAASSLFLWCFFFLLINTVSSSSWDEVFCLHFKIPENFLRLILKVGFWFLHIPFGNHHHVVSPARISLILSRHFSLPFIATGRSSGLHPESLHSCCMYVGAGRHAVARPYVGVHKRTLLMSSSLLLQQWPTCLLLLNLIVFVMGGQVAV